MEICIASALDGALDGIAHCLGSRGDGDGVFMVHLHGIIVIVSLVVAVDVVKNSKKRI